MKKLKSDLILCHKHWIQVLTLIICFLPVLFTIPVFSQNDPVADFTADQTTGCQGMVVIFTDKSIDADNWSWTFSGGNPSSANTQGPHQVTYQNPGVFDVILDVSNQHGSDKEIKSGYIVIDDCSPIADFSVTSASGCKPLTVTYTDQSTDATTWSWYFPGGNPSSAQNQGPHTVTYTNTGSYNATLVVANQYGQDTAVKNNVVTVSQCYDFGDAPPPYKTLLKDDGARHLVDISLYLGQGVDAEVEGLPDSTATGDDNDGYDDEDGVEWLQNLVPGDTTLVRVTASKGGFIRAWIDFNQDGDWEDEGEEACNTQLGEGSNELRVIVPDNAKEGYTFARFRFSSNTIPSFDGTITDGEVEDMRVYVENIKHYDYGDAPDDKTNHYMTLLKHNGARHPVSEDDGIWLGRIRQDSFAIDFSSLWTLPDQEEDGQPDLDAMGDNNADLDDECGVYFWQPLVPGDTSSVIVLCIGEAILHGWFDWNQNGEWNHLEEYAINYEVSGLAGLFASYIKIVKFWVPETALLGNTYARFRYSTDPSLFPSGRASNGEVEDYQCTVSSYLYDYGDAPDSYGTRKPDGACHKIQNLIRLGEKLDGESDGMPSVNAFGDDTHDEDDEDGVVFPLLIPGETARLRITTYNSLSRAILHGWIDYNQDGVFHSFWERVIDRAIPDDGTHTYTINIPASAKLGYTYARFRYTNAPDSVYPSLFFSVIDPTGYIPYEGEVEDYRIHIGEMRFDYGDAPYPFKTMLQDDGARHPIDSTVYLGSGVSPDENGRPDSLATSDDDDGVVFQGEWVAGDTVIAKVNASTQGFLSVWLYLQPVRQGEPDDSLSSGTIRRTDAKIEYIEDFELPIPVPVDAGTGPAYLRFRFSTQPIDSMHGIAFDGEVEDYMVVIDKPADISPDHSEKVPKIFSLMQNYPNPFNNRTEIEYFVRSRSQVVLKIMNLKGNCIQILVDETQPSGKYTVNWDGRDSNGMPAGSGIYFIQLHAGTYHKTRKMILMK
jgi:PKD repeat protein